MKRPSRTRRAALLAGVMACLAAGCANKVTPSGGAKDTAPPKVTVSIPENYSADMVASEIRVEFDEYIQLLNLQKQLIVSPLVDPRPDIQVRKKTLVIRFEKPLRPNTTYTINFGDAIADIHENNAIRDFKYVFSTGPFLDSLTLNGRVTFARNLETEEGITVLLYRHSENGAYDSLPDYFTRTDASGYFRFSHLAKGSYRILALKDANGDYRPDDNEEIAFLDGPVTSGTDAPVRMRMFKPEEPRLRMVDARTVVPGMLQATFNTGYHPLSCRALGPDAAPWVFEEYNPNRDTVVLWMADTNVDTLQVVFYDGGTAIDTALFRPWYRPGKKGSVPELPVITPGLTGRPLNPGDTLMLRASHPVRPPDTSLIRFLADTLPVALPAFSFADSSRRLIKVETDWQPGTGYGLTLLPGVWTDYRGRVVRDTVKIEFNVRPLKDLGTLQLVLALPGDEPCILQLESKGTVARERMVNQTADLKFDFLPPGTYRLKIIFDTNGNGRWDAGDFRSGRQPEEVLYYKDDVTIRANWDLETVWQVNKSGDP